ncbi:MAG: hypothetical protein H6977_01060 [Gammaproteobacteria bacterium]|nr:hypothetical protein [Gammaproteobacteria bacterium]
MRVAPVALLLFGVTAPVTAQTAAAGEPALLPAWLARLTATIAFSAERIEWAGGDATNVHAALHVDTKGAELTASSAAFAGGRAELSVHHQPDGDTTVAADLGAVDLGASGLFTGYVRALPIDVRLRLRGHGATRGALLASANGRIDVRDHGEGTIERGIERAGGSVFGALFDAFSPFHGDGDTSRVACLRARADVVDGRAAAPLLVQLWTRRMRLAGGGSIDFVAGTLDLHLTPTARQGIRIGGLNAVHDITVSGLFTAPAVEVDSGRLLQRAARLGTAVATIGGAAVIETLAARREEVDRPCAALAARQADWP